MNNTTTKNTQSAQLNAASSELKFVSSFMALHMSALSFLQERSINLFNNTNPGENQTTRKPLLTLINMKNQTKKQILMSCLIALSSLFLANGAFAANISSRDNGSWSSTSTWNGGVVPVAGDNVTIDDDVTISSSSTVSITNLTINSSKQLTNDGQLTITGTFSNSGTADFNNTGNTVIFSGSNTITLTRNFSFYNLTIGSGSTLNTHGSNSSTNNFSVANNLVITGTLVLQNVRSGTTPATRTLKNITINSGGILTESGSIALSITGNFTNNGTFTANSAVHTLTGTGVNISGTVNLGSVVIDGTITNNALLEVSTFTINSGKSFTMGTSTGMTVTGNFVNNGTFTKSDAAVTFSGSSAQTISGTASSTNFNTLIINKTAAANTVTCSSAVNIYKTLTVTKGKLASAGNLTIKSIDSTSTGTARISELVADADITGDVTVERFVNAGNKIGYRFMSSPVNSVTIFNNWQEGGSNSSTKVGYGAHITGPGATGPTAPSVYNATNGLDYTPFSNYSLYTMGAGSTWVGVTNTNVDFGQGNGYNIYIRGDRTYDLYASAPVQNNTQTIMRVKGPLNKGNVIVTLNPGWNLIGNPYACPIDWSANGWSKAAGIGQAIYVRNPAVASSNVAANLYSCHNGTVGVNDWTAFGPVIESCQGFLVKSTAATTVNLTFTESYKTSSLGRGYFKNNTVADLLRVEYLFNGLHTDEIAINFSANGSKSIDRSVDAETMGSSTFGLASLKNTSRLAISTRPVFETVDTITLSVRANVTGKFAFKFTEIASFGGMTQIVLIDKFLNKMVNIDATTTYNFDVTSNPNSIGDNRFVILLSKVGTAAFTTGLLNSNEINSSVSLYPNPATSTINLACSNANVKDFSFEIYNQMGQSVSTGAGNFANGNVEAVNIENLDKGIYFVKMFYNNNSEIIRFVK